MAAARLVTVTLVRAWEPGATAEEADRIDFAIALDPQGQPDVQAWHDDPAPWPATRRAAGQPAEAGDVAHDEEGWQLRFFVPRDGADPDAPAHRIRHLGSGFRPGEVLTLRDPQGEESAWRVVGLA